MTEATAPEPWTETRTDNSTWVMLRSARHPNAGAIWIVDALVDELLEHGWTYEPRPAVTAS